MEGRPAHPCSHRQCRRRSRPDHGRRRTLPARREKWVPRPALDHSVHGRSPDDSIRHQPDQLAFQVPRQPSRSLHRTTFFLTVSLALACARFLPLCLRRAYVCRRTFLLGTDVPADLDFLSPDRDTIPGQNTQMDDHQGRPHLRDQRCRNDCRLCPCQKRRVLADRGGRGL
ncbi:hypothetical protein D3C80_1288640 [compost metagenome]